MAIEITTYVDPGVYVQETIVPSALSINTVPQTLAILGAGDILKRASNEAVVRGRIAGETLTVASSSPHTATLAHTSTGLQADSILYEDGVPLSMDLWQFNSATQVQVADTAFTSGAVYTIDYVATDTDRDALANDNAREAVRVGSFAGVSNFSNNIDYQLDAAAQINSPVPDTFDLSTNDQLYLQVDGLPEIIITVAGATPATSTAAEVVADINAALIADSNYGATYGTVASVYQGDQVRLTSPTQDPTSQIRINSGATNAAGAVFGISSFPFIADSDVIDWSIDQAAELEGTNASPFNLAAVSVLDLAFDDLVDGAVQAEWTTLAAGPYDTTGASNNLLGLNIDDRGDITITLSVGAAITAATIVAEINAALLASSNYGATYASVASVVATNRVRLTSPTTGSGSSVEIQQESGAVGIAHTRIFELDNTQVPLLQTGDGSVACRLDVGGAITIAAIIADINARFADHSRYGSDYSTVAQNNGANFLRLLSPIQGATSKVRVQQSQTASAHTVVLGLATAQLPYTITGTGSRPAVASVYFVTYDYERPSSDYDVAIRVFNEDQLFAQVGELSLDNPLAIAGQIAFENDAPSIFVVQVEDSDGDGAYSVADFTNAINDGLDNSAITEVAVLDTRLGVQSVLLNHIVGKSSILEKKYRRGWFGMARDTEIGDVDTADTLIYRAKRTLQVAADSPGRGRFILCAPPNVDRTLTLPDGTQPTAELDSTYVAVAVAARHTSFTSVATSLLRKLVTGFDVDTFQTYLDAERHLLAPSGVLVVTNDAGRLVLLDPVTTEAGGGGLLEFSEISAGAQKDNAVRAVTQALDANLVGVVPEDLTDFVFDIKTVITTTLLGLIQSGAIGPFKDSQGRPRDVNMASDMQVFQSPTDPTTFTFRFFFNLRYPAKRLFGEYSVDNPFFSVATTTATS